MSRRWDGREDTGGSLKDADEWGMKRKEMNSRERGGTRGKKQHDRKIGDIN